ncbi:hypothetical protein [Williamsia deligens]|uniref:Uncharacterized protein n=1 Tax=Williamsia deligens TaxID=321325 RepID=A0ABW3G3U4_9NOCA|nr:hypothetical protein [Williamsia deligens]MCP2194522.1 hypothetical protein [Williamsia deligens]
MTQIVDILLVLSFPSYLELSVIVGAGAFVALLFAHSPRAAFVFWMVVLVAVPFWFVFDAFPLPPATVAFAVIAPCILINRPTEQVGFMGSDRVLWAVFGIGLAAYLFLDTPKYAITTVIFQWATAYIVGRRLALVCGLEFVGDVLAWAGAIVGLWACVELAFSWHVFEHTNTISQKLGFWANIQTRGGLDRSEGAFGHALALGGFLSLTVPYVMTMRQRRLRLPFTVVVIAGVLATFSRGPISSALLAVVLALVFLSGRVVDAGTRFWGVVLSLAVGVGLVPFILTKFSTLDARELDPSTNYRENLWRLVPGDMSIIGQARNVGVDSAGRSLYREFGSIDSTPLLTGLDFGWVVTMLLVAGVLAIIYRVISGKGTVADVALFGQVITLLTVALITQYCAAIWLLVGLVAAEQAHRRHQTQILDSEPVDLVKQPA